MRNIKWALAIFLFSTLAMAGATRVLDGAQITNGAATLTLPTTTTNILGDDTTNTLTNKTIDGDDNTLQDIDLTTAITGILPIANGGTGQSTQQGAIDSLMPDQSGQGGNFLTTDGTNVSWAASSGGANTALSNLAAVDINAPLQTADDATADANATESMSILTGDKTAGTGNSGNITLQTGSSAGGSEGYIYLENDAVWRDAAGNSATADEFFVGVLSEASSAGNSVAYMVAASPTTGTHNKPMNVILRGGEARGDSVITVRTGAAYLSGGDVEGTATAPETGEMIVRSGRNNNAAATVNTGEAKLESGNNDGTGSSGIVRVRSGYSTTGNSGEVNLHSGAAATGDSGDVVIETGSASGTQGAIKLKDGSQGVSGHYLVSQGTDGEIGWQAADFMARDFSNALNATGGINMDSNNITNIGNLSVVDSNDNSTSLDTLNFNLTSKATDSGNENFFMGTQDSSSGTPTKTLDVTISTGRVNGTSAATVATGSMFLNTGDVRDTATVPETGEIRLRSGRNRNASADVDTGQARLESGYNDGTGASGEAQLRSGYTTTGDSGRVLIDSGTVVTGDSGDIQIGSGNVTTGNSGNIILTAGSASGTRGDIVFQVASDGTAGHVWKSTDTGGTGNWEAISEAAPDISGTRAAPTAIVAANGVLFTSAEYFNVHFIDGGASPVDITADPQIASATNVGQRLTLIGRDATNTVTLEDGTGLSLNGTMVLAEDSSIELMWDGTNWTELSRR